MRPRAELMDRFFYNFQLCIETNLGFKVHTFLLEYYDTKTIHRREMKLPLNKRQLITLVIQSSSHLICCNMNVKRIFLV